jgi:SPP1 family predicted phage head-tail adaptor
MMEVGKLSHKVELWGNIKEKNELNEWTHKPDKIKDIFAEIIPQTGNMSRQQGIETIISRTTHKFIIHYRSGINIVPDNLDNPNISNDMWFKYRGKRFDILYMIDSYFNQEKWEIFCEEVIG